MEIVKREDGGAYFPNWGRTSLYKERGFNGKKFLSQMTSGFDEVKISYNDYKALEDFAKVENPLDIIWGKTVPLEKMRLDFQISPNDTSNNGAFAGKYCTATFCCGRDWKDLTPFNDGTVGVADIFVWVGNDVVFNFYFSIGGNNRTTMHLDADCVFYGENAANLVENASAEEAETARYFYYTIARNAVNAWLLIQLALLHPLSKEVIKEPKVERIIERKQLRNGKQGKRVVRYVRHFSVNEDALAAIKSAREKRKYSCKAWYVIGHWRTYRDGRKVFIQPYWKGELRYLKSASESRERKIVIKD